MTVTSGFFNSLDGDRVYDAEQMSSIFDGIVNDGVYEGYANAFSVNGTGTTGDNTVYIDTGRAWFNHVWILNDSKMSFTLDEADVLYDRIDAVIFDIDSGDDARAGSIIVKKGTAAASPVNPTMIHTATHNQYPIVYIRRPKGSSEIVASDINFRVGHDDCPYVTGIIKTRSISDIVTQWEGQFQEWIASQDMAFANWESTKKAAFEAWFAELEVILDEEVAAHLAAQILEINGRLDKLAEHRIMDAYVLDDTEEYYLTNADGDVNVLAQVSFASGRR